MPDFLRIDAHTITTTHLQLHQFFFDVLFDWYLFADDGNLALELMQVDCEEAAFFVARLHLNRRVAPDALLHIELTCGVISNGMVSYGIASVQHFIRPS